MDWYDNLPWSWTNCCLLSINQNVQDFISWFNRRQRSAHSFRPQHNYDFNFWVEILKQNRCRAANTTLCNCESAPSASDPWHVNGAVWIRFGWAGDVFPVSITAGAEVFDWRTYQRSWIERQPPKVQAKALTLKNRHRTRAWGLSPLSSPPSYLLLSQG